MPTTVLGISAYYHDSAAALVRDGEIIAAAQEERFTRKKHDARFPRNAVDYCLREAGITPEELTYVAFYDKPILKFERILQTYLGVAPGGLRQFWKAMPVWLKEKLGTNKLIRAEFPGYKRRILFGEHHESHAASAFYPSPFEEAAVLTIDGVGEWATTTYGVGRGSELELLGEINFPHSLGMLYSAFTYYTGFKVNSGEYKVMGLAPYGEPRFVDQILEHVMELRDDGSFHLKMDKFDFLTGLKMTSGRFDDVFGGPPRQPETQLSQREMDLAASVQVVTEMAMDKMARFVREETGMKNLCLAGGVALNCVSNGKLLRSKIFDNLWIQPAAGDAGGALGVALSVWHKYLQQPRKVRDDGKDLQSGSYLGPRPDNEGAKAYFEKIGAPYKEYSEEELPEAVAELLASEKVVGLCQGRMEFGPRALGGRSIMGDARSQEMQTTMNLKIKFRESFRPFAPSCLEEEVNNWFEQETPSPYMLLVAPVREEHRIPMTEEQTKLFGIDKLKIPRSKIPAVTHVDYSARIQTVSRDTNPVYYDIIKSFHGKTGCPVIVNTSFNVRGEPIVCTTEDSYRCFMRTNMDALVVERCVLLKEEQPEWKEVGDWRDEFELD
ncbi:MAG TPA: carbamoyltransferase [Planctomycetes bacterium]|nr:carbamoyltransferase [Planctomycetota bacterium]